MSGVRVREFIKVLEAMPEEFKDNEIIFVTKIKNEITYFELNQVMIHDTVPNDVLAFDNANCTSDALVAYLNSKHKEISPNIIPFPSNGVIN